MAGDLISLFDRSCPDDRLGGLRRLAVRRLAAIRAHDLGILVGHFVQECGERLTAMVTQSFDRVTAHIAAGHRLPHDCEPPVAGSYRLLYGSIVADIRFFPLRGHRVSTLAHPKCLTRNFVLPEKKGED